MKTQDVIEHFGSVLKVAEALGITRYAVYLWGEEVPAVRQYHIEVITDGALKADRKTTATEAS